MAQDKKRAGRPARTPRDPNAPKENKAEKFRRLAIQRVPRALKAINSVANLADAGYEHTPEQAEKVLSVLINAVDVLRKRFEGGTVQTDTFDV
jgi:hypothetical protein